MERGNGGGGTDLTQAGRGTLSLAIAGPTALSLRLLFIQCLVIFADPIRFGKFPLICGVL